MVNTLRYNKTILIINLPILVINIDGEKITGHTIHKTLYNTVVIVNNSKVLNRY